MALRAGADIVIADLVHPQRRRADEVDDVAGFDAHFFGISPRICSRLVRAGLKVLA